MGRGLETINWEQEFPEVPEQVHAAVEEACRLVLEKEEIEKRKISAKRVLLLAACFTMFSGMTVFAATGLWKQRMEAMNQKEVEAYFLSIAESGAPAFRYNRGMTEAEQALFGELQTVYEEEGEFPKGCVTMLSEGEAYQGKGIAYDPVSGTFFLPEEVTEEQFLQVIDFYHKAEYAVQKVNAQVEKGEIPLPRSETGADLEAAETEREPAMRQEFETLNEKVEYVQYRLGEEESPKAIAVGAEYLYMAFSGEIKRMSVEGGEPEAIYHLAEGQMVLAMGADKQDNLYVSLREKEEETESYTNKLVKLDKDGNVSLHYRVEEAVFDGDRSLQETMAYRLLPGPDGKLYVKERWAGDFLLYVFDETGSYAGAIYDSAQKTHPAGGMCFGKDGMLYVLGQEAILKVDTEEGKVLETYAYTTEEMVAAVDVLYPMEEERFYLISYDGVFVTELGTGTSERMVAPFESEVFAEGSKSYPVSEDTMVLVNYKNPGVQVTYLKIRE